MKKVIALIGTIAILAFSSSTALATPTNPYGWSNFYWSSIFPTQGKGAHNPLIKGLQTYLTYENVVSPGTVDGIFGSNTKSSVMSYQGLHNCTVDGIVGPQTWGRMHGNLTDYQYDYPLLCAYKSPGSESSVAQFAILGADGDWAVVVPSGLAVVIYEAP